MLLCVGRERPLIMQQLHENAALTSTDPLWSCVQGFMDFPHSSPRSYRYRKSDCQVDAQSKAFPLLLLLDRGHRSTTYCLAAAYDSASGSQGPECWVPGDSHCSVFAWPTRSFFGRLAASAAPLLSNILSTGSQWLAEAHFHVFSDLR
ncbi:hypothetical protein H113_08012 [Trichophyton rubrum MR1459]|uniref:Uncharacterized protein n=3 Tax=Trichophyton TaxID=5550 RepID=A0A178EUB7_TRIRU|nr:uncharacterized protein TERG_00528 [Trichophyton rubrum CBS 118892]EZF69634.1 hypothetical protein H105_07949 [Trichophyton soudanense CBS 452.61]EZF90831.1 hypothetical protein H113_08012 [Trichophyton rubrum MR1459]EZG02223.1 hypothetical protein H106_07791 [Trichophyton rubrum CBS 735.88]EZG12568.1 hypothetical protein H107_08089 [Trichophyton rubrum CBS 202.88]OAL63396.1 hypothetical protein A7C99_5790 [Trichophyton rubrum]